MNARHQTLHRPLQKSARTPVIARVLMLALAFVASVALAACGPTGPQDELDGGEPAVLESPAAPTDEADSSEPATAAPTTEAPTTPAPTTTATPTPTTALEPVAAEGTALAVLAGLDEKGRAPKADYDRELFGWRDDMDRNGCDTRNDILRRDLTAITLKGGTNGCVVQRGTLDSPYSGNTVDFDRENSTVDIDHVVALSDAWQTGAASWDEQTRREFANDPLNLLAVESSLNRQKGDGDAATWLPPKKDYRCEYVARQIAVKDKYDLWVKPAEADAMERVLGDCEGFLAIEDDDQWPATGEGDVVATEEEHAPATTEQEPAPEPEPAYEPAPTEESGSSGASVSGPFENCTAAREAGAAPVYATDPGYGPHLDGDSDGVGCE